jgi:hypothetical protein
MIQDPKLVLPNTSAHWPITKKRPQNAWSSSLLKHITYGTFIRAVFEKPVRPFGFPVGQHISICRLTAEQLDSIVFTCTAVRKWAKYNSTGSFGFKLVLITIQDINIPSIDLMSLHGLRYVFPEITVASTVEVSSTIITNDP